MFTYNKIKIIYMVIANLRKDKYWSYEQFIKFIREVSPEGFLLRGEDVSSIQDELVYCHLVDAVYENGDIIGMSM